MKNPWVITIVVLAVLIGGSVLFSGKAVDKNNEGVEVMSHIKGNLDAEIKLVEYSDFECPACSSFHPAVILALDKFGEDISFEYKHFPLPIHKSSQTAALAAEAAAQQGKFFEFHDLLFIRQSEWTKSAIPAAVFVQYAEELGLDVETFKRHTKSTLLRDKIMDEYKEAVDLKLTGTPTFFLNGEVMKFSSYQDFITMIESAVNGTSSSTATSTTDSGPAIKFGL